MLFFPKKYPYILLADKDFMRKNAAVSAYSLAWLFLP